MKAKFRNKEIILIILSVILIIIIAIAIFFIKNNLKWGGEIGQTGEISENTATRIIDGDTFELASGEIVRLICVDAPEKGAVGYEEATNFLFSLVYQKEVRLEKDIEDKDKYTRLLRYVYVLDEDGNEIFVNKEIIKNEYGTLFVYGNSTSKCEEIGE